MISTRKRHKNHNTIWKVLIFVILTLCQSWWIKPSTKGTRFPPCIPYLLSMLAWNSRCSFDSLSYVIRILVPPLSLESPSTSEQFLFFGGGSWKLKVTGVKDFHRRRGKTSSFAISLCTCTLNNEASFYARWEFGYPILYALYSNSLNDTFH